MTAGQHRSLVETYRASPMRQPILSSFVRTACRPTPSSSYSFLYCGLLTQPTRKMAQTSDLGIESTNIQTAPGVTLTEQQRTLTGSVLDLFLGKATLKKLSLWSDDGVFEDPITVARGRKQYEPQWYGLAAMFPTIERLSHEVRGAGNPIDLHLKTRYVLKGLGTEQVIDSMIRIGYDESTGKITKVEDRWNDKLPDGAFTQAMRKLNAVTVPHLISVPKNAEEDAAKQKSS